MLIVALLFSACSSWMVTDIRNVKPKSFVEIKLASGSKVEGEVIASDSEQTIIRTSGKAYKIDNSNIISLRTKPVPYDEQGESISESEIELVKTHKQMILYAIGGAALSFGTSFFIGSMVQRSLLEDDTNSTPRIIITVAGTAIGGVFFALIGDKKDRDIAIENIKELRIQGTKNNIAGEQTKRVEIAKELELLNKLREAQDAEIEALKKKIEEAQKKKELDEKKKNKIPPPIKQRR